MILDISALYLSRCKFLNACSYVYLFMINRALTGLLTYFIVGGIILKFHKKESGTDIIPNKRFWFSLPFLVKVCMKTRRNLKCYCISTIGWSEIYCNTMYESEVQRLSTNLGL